MTKVNVRHHAFIDFFICLVFSSSRRLKLSAENFPLPVELAGIWFVDDVASSTVINPGCLLCFNFSESFKREKKECSSCFNRWKQQSSSN